MTDQQLIDLYFARDEGAVAETERKYGAYCRAIARRLLADSRDVEECLSDCALAVWNAIPPQRPERFKGWLGAIVRNRALAIGRQNGWLSMNDIRGLENMNPVPEEDGGNALLVNGNMVSVRRAMLGGSESTTQEGTMEDST